MSMYKNIFVNETADWSASSEKIVGVNGEVLIFGETAFSSVDEAISAVGDGSAIVIKVASGKYDSFKIITDGVQADAAKVVAVNFGGAPASGETPELTKTNFSSEYALSVVNDLTNANAANGTVFVVADDVAANVATATVNVGINADGSYAAVSSDVARDVIAITQVQEVVDPINDFFTLVGAENVSGAVINIDNLEEFKAFRDAVNAGHTFAKQTVQLTDDIDLAGEEWIPIGSSATKFNGTFDGGGNTISNLVVNGGSKSYQGLFGYTAGGAIKNFTLDGAIVSGRLGVGAVAGSPYTSKFSDITVTGLVQISGFSYVGGIGGRNAYADWTNVHMIADEGSFVKANSIEGDVAYRTYVGGVIGFMGEGGHTLSNISSNINVSGTTCDVGGIIGIAHYGNNLKDVTCSAEKIEITNGSERSDAAEIGGIAGVWYNESGSTVTMENVSSSATLEATYKDANGETQKITSDASKSGEGFTQDADLAANVIYGASYNTPTDANTGKLEVGSSGLKQFASDYTIKAGAVESTVNAVVGASGIDGYDEAIADDGEMSATVKVAGTLNVTGAQDSKYLYIGGKYKSETDNVRFGLEVDGGVVNSGAAQGLNIRNDGYLKVSNGGKFNGSLIVTKNAGDADQAGIEVTGEGSELIAEYHSINLRGTGMEVTDGGKVTLVYRGEADNSIKLTEGSSLTVASGGTITSRDDFGSFDQYIDIEEGSSLVVDGGIIDVDSVVNNGTFTVAGESTLDIANMTGDNIQAADGAVIKDSTIGVGGITATGDLTFKGDNKLGGFSMGFFGHNVTIGADASLETTGTGRLSLAYANTLDVDGSITDAKTADKATTKKSLNVAGGVSITGSAGFGEANNGAVLDVDNAYVSLGSTTSKNNAATGDFVLDFNNSIVDFTKDFQTAASTGDGLTPTYQLNVTDSVMTVADRFAFDHANSTAVIDNSTLDIANQFKNVGSFTLQNGSEMSVGGNADGPSYEKTGNFGTLNVKSGSTFAMADTAASAAYPFYNAGTVNVAGANFNVANVKNEGNFTVSGESTLKIDSVTNTSDDATRIQIADGTTLVESNVGGYINLQGSLTVEDGLTVSAIRAGNPVGEEVTNSVISGDKITVSGNGRFQNGTYKINADMHFDQYVYLSYGGTFTITSDLTAGTTPQESDGAFWINGNVTLKDGASMVATNGGNIIFNNYTDTVLTVEAGAMVSVYDISDYKMAAVLNVSGSVSASHFVSAIGEINVTDGTLSAEYFKDLDINSINLTVTDKKLASLGKDSYIMLEQTTRNGHPYEFDLTGVGVTYNGKVYNVGDSITIGDVVYNITNGDGNDIAIEAAAVAVTLDSSVTSNGLDKFAQAGEFFELHDSYAERIQNLPEMIVVNGTNTLDTDKSKYYFYTDRDLTIAGGTLDVSNAGRFYFMDTVAPNGTAAADADLSDVATVTIEEGATLKGYINLGQAIDNGDDVDENGNVTRDGGAMNMVVKGTLDQKNLYVNSGSTLTVTETGKVTHYGSGGDNNLRANAKVVVNGTGKDGDVQFASGWWTIRGGEMEFNNTNAETGTLRLNADNENALVTGDTTASLTVNNSRLDAYAIEIDNADSSFTAKDSIIETTLLENAGTATVTGDSTLKVNKLVGTLNVADATINDGSFIKGKAGSVDISGSEVNFDGNVTIEAALNANKSSDATTINVNDGAVVTIAGKEYDQYNGGVNLGASDTLNVDGTLNISGDNLYLKATTNVNEGGALNITDAGFQNTYGKLTVKGDMNITDTFSDGAYQNIKLAGNDNASTIGSLDVDGGTLTIDAPSFAFGGGFKSNGWVDVTSADVTVQNGGKITTNAVVFRNGVNSTMTLDNGTLEFTEAGDFGTVHSTLGTRIDNYGTINVTNGSTLDLGDRSLVNEGIINVSNSTLEDIKISGAGETGYVRAEDAVLSNVTVTGQETRTVNTDFNGGTYTGKVYTGYDLVDGEWARVADSETTINGTVDASSVYWQNYGKLTIAEGAELKTSYFSEGSKQVLTVDGTISAGTFRGYNGVVSETGKINAQAAVQFYGNPDTKRQYDINGEVVVTHDIDYAHNIVVGFNTAKQWYGDGPNDYWNIGGANTEVNVSGEKAKLQIVAGKAGKGTAMIHVDEEGTKATLISDKARFLVDGKVINNGNLNIADNAVAVITGDVTNSGSITVDAGSSFSAGAIVNTGTFNSSNAGEMIVLGDMTVSGNINTTDLVLQSGSVLSAASITVTNLTLAIGSALTLTGSGSSADNIRVIGDIKPAQAEFILVTQNWFGGSSVWYDQNGDNVKNEGEIFEVKGDAAGLSGINFVSKDGNLYVADFGATPTGVYISDDLVDATPGKKVTVNGATYTVGTDAFSSVNDMPNSMDKSLITEITLGNGDHVSDIDDTFSALETIHVEEGKRIVDTEASVFDNDLIINNDGHLEADIAVNGYVTLTNTSSNTFVGALTGDYVDVINTATGKVENAALTANGMGEIIVDNLGVIENTTMTAVDGSVSLTGNGTFTNVDVTTDALYLNGIDFTLDADSTVGTVYMDQFDGTAGGNLVLDGASVGIVDSNGTGSVELTANSDLANVSIQNVDSVTLSGGTHSFSEVAQDQPIYYMNQLNIGNAGLNWQFTDDQELEYNIGTPMSVDKIAGDKGVIKVVSTDANAAMNFVQNGEYSLDNFNVNGFNGKVNVDTNAVLNLGDATDYFGNDAELDIDGVLNLDLENASTGMDFNGDGTINVNKNQTFTDAAALDGFTGDLYANADLTLNGANDTDAIFHGAGNVTANDDLTFGAAAALNNFTGDVKANGADVDVSLDGENITSATFSGAGNLNVNANQTLNADNALNITGTLTNNGKVITLEGKNDDIKAAVAGSGNILANADQNFTGDVSAYAGSYEAAANSSVTFSGTLADDMTLNGAGKFVLDTNDVDVNISSDDAATNLCINNNDVTVNGGTFGEVTGVAGSEFIIAANAAANSVNVEALVINAGVKLSSGSVDADSTTIAIADNTFYGPSITVTGTSDFGQISVDSWSSHFNTPYILIDSEVVQTYGDVTFSVGSNSALLSVNGIAKRIGDEYVRVYLGGNDGFDLLIGNYDADSSVIYVNSSWSNVEGTVYQWQGIDNTTDRIIGLDASKTLVNAVEILKAENGEGKIFIVKGATYTSPDALMTIANGATDLLIEGNAVDSSKPVVEPGDAVIKGGIVGMENAMSGNLTLKNVSVNGNIIGGAEINTTSGTADIVTSLTIDGGNHRSSQVIGGSYVTGGTYTTGSSTLTLKNTTGEAMSISGRVVGGSFASGNGRVIQDSANVVIDTDDGAISIRGDIYAAGSGNVSVTNSSVTFTGDARDLTFTGRVSGQAYGNTNAAENSQLIFADFNGEFNGLIQGFDTITVSGNSELEFSRKQTLTADTDFVFNVAGRTSTDAMFTVNSFGWTYDDIMIDATSATSGEYVLVDNWDASFAGDILVNGSAVTIGQSISVGDSGYSVELKDGSLVFSVFNTQKIEATGDVVNTDVVKDVAETNSSKLVEVKASDTTVTNKGTLIAADTQGSVAVYSNKADTEVVNEGTIIAADVEKYNRAIHSEGANLELSNSGVINGSIYSNHYSTTAVNIENSGEITSYATSMGDNSVVTTSNGLLTLSGNGGTYELAANPESGKFTGEIVEGQHGILVTADNSVFKAGSDVTVGTGTVKGLYNDSGKNIEISGDGNSITIVNKSSAYGIEEFSYEDYGTNPGSDVILSGDSTTISVTSRSDAKGIIARNGDIIISGSGVEISAVSVASYAIGLETNDVKDYSGNIVIGEFNADGSVASASDVKITVEGVTTFSGYNPARHNIAVYAKKGTAQIALDADGVISSNNTAIYAESIDLTSKGTIKGDVVATGSASNDTMNLDINSILDGAVDLKGGDDTLNITGLKALNTNDYAGAKALIAEGISNIESINIDGVAVAANGNAVQLDTDLWAQVSNSSDGLVVGWGETEAAAGVALDAFELNKSTLATGDSLLASASDLGADNALSSDDFKKNSGTLA